MLHPGTILIETDRLILRPLTLADATAMYANWASDYEVARYVTWDTHANVEETSKLMAFWEKQYEQADFYLWGMVIKETGQLIGTFAFTDLSDRHQIAELGYCIGKDWWNQGYTTEAGQALLAFGFDQLGLNRIQAVHDVRNPASGRVMEKLGMTLEGTIKQARLVKGHFVSICLYGILAQDWKSNPLRNKL